MKSTAQYIAIGAALMAACGSGPADTATDETSARQHVQAAQRAPRPKPVRVARKAVTVYDDRLAFPVMRYASAADGGLRIDDDPTVAKRGASSLRLIYSHTTSPGPWGGIVFTVNKGWRTDRPAYDLSQFSQVEFYAKSLVAGTRVEVGTGVDLERTTKDSGTAEKVLVLSDRWQKYSLPVADLDVSDVNGLFKIGFRQPNPKQRGWGSSTVWFDDIKWTRASRPTAARGNPHERLR